MTGGAAIVDGRAAAASASFGARAGLRALAFVLTYGIARSTDTPGEDRISRGLEAGVVGYFLVGGALAAALLIGYRYLAVRF